ncbi:MAG: hypothetical protein U0796_12170 [Gemmatales bacterium]
MRLPLDKAVQCIKLLMEGCSIRSTERVTGVNRDTICNLIVTAGEKAKQLLESRIVNIKVEDVECDEIWGFVGMKEKTRMFQYPMSDEGYGDAWCYVGFESNTKLILSWHLGKRTPLDTQCFMEKLRETVADGFQLTTDGFKPYPNAVHSVFGRTVDYAQLVKQYGESDDDRRYSPPSIIRIDKNVIIGQPAEDRVCTSYVERNNLSIRTFVRRMTRLTCAFSKKWENHEAALALYFAYYNFCWKHSTLKTTPAVAAGIATKQWTVEELLTAN